MAKDTNSFKADTNQLTSILASTNAGIPALEQQINTYNDSIKRVMIWLSLVVYFV